MLRRRVENSKRPKLILRHGGVTQHFPVPPCFLRVSVVNELPFLGILVNRLAKCVPRDVPRGTLISMPPLR